MDEQGKPSPELGCGISFNGQAKVTDFLQRSSALKTDVSPISCHKERKG